MLVGGEGLGLTVVTLREEVDVRCDTRRFGAD